MEINAANVKLFARSQVLSTKKWMRKETNSVSFLQKKYKKLRTMPSQKQRKGHIVQNETIQRYVSVKFPIKSCKISNMNIEILRPSWRLCNDNNFYLNVTEWLATPGGTKFLKPIEEMSKEELNVFLKRFCTSARKKDPHCHFTKVNQWNPSESRHWSFPSRSLPPNKPFSFISDPAFTEANKAFDHLQKTSEKRRTLSAY